MTDPMQEAGAMWEALKTHWLPDDDPPDVQMQAYYLTKYRLACELRDRIGLTGIVEIGVRAGYSAFAFLWANPQASYLGIDANEGGWGGVVGYGEHARRTLARFPNIELWEADSSHLTNLPGTYTLAHVDGDHSYEGCYHDINLMATAASAILVDDYDMIAAVRAAADHWAVIHAATWGVKYVGDGGFRGNLLLLRKAAFK